MTDVTLNKVTFEFTQDEHCMSNDMDGVESLTIECTSDFGISKKSINLLILSMYSGKLTLVVRNLNKLQV